MTARPFRWPPHEPFGSRSQPPRRPRPEFKLTQTAASAAGPRQGGPFLQAPTHEERAVRGQ